MVAPLKSSSLKVLHVVTQLELGGAQHSTLDILSRLDRKKYLPHLVSSDGPLTSTAYNIPWLSVLLLSKMRSTIDPISLIWDVPNFVCLVRFIRKGGFQIVHTHSSKAGILARWAARLAGVPVIIHTVHGFGFNEFQPVLLRKFYQALERLTARMTDRLIVVSERDRRVGLELKIGTPEKYKLIRYGINQEKFCGAAPPPAFSPQANGLRPFGTNAGGGVTSRQEARRVLGLGTNAPVVGTIACMKPQKAPLDFVRACRLIKNKIPEAQFVMVGDGVLRRQVEHERRKLGLEGSLRLLGWRRDISRILAALDIFMLTSRWEGLPIACMEALAAGLPVVATQVGGTPELVRQGENGFLVPVRIVSHLAKETTRILKDPVLYDQMSQHARASLGSEHTIDHMVSETEDLYEECLRRTSLCSRVY